MFPNNSVNSNTAGHSRSTILPRDEHFLCKHLLISPNPRKWDSVPAVSLPLIPEDTTTFHPLPTQPAIKPVPARPAVRFQVKVPSHRNGKKRSIWKWTVKSTPRRILRIRKTESRKQMRGLGRRGRIKAMGLPRK